jgi:hypothetical protein
MLMKILYARFAKQMWWTNLHGNLETSIINGEFDSFDEMISDRSNTIDDVINAF